MSWIKHPVNLEFLSKEQFFGFAANSPVSKETRETFSMKTVIVDITDTMAIMKVEDLYQGLQFTDYPSMIKKGDQWLIVKKTHFHKCHQDITSRIIPSI